MTANQWPLPLTAPTECQACTTEEQPVKHELPLAAERLGAAVAEPYLRFASWVLKHLIVLSFKRDARTVVR
jgi:hypothetical protein